MEENWRSWAFENANFEDSKIVSEESGDTSVTFTFSRDIKCKVFIDQSTD